jgi:hypothetical protein
VKPKSSVDALNFMNTNPPLRAARYYEIRISRSERDAATRSRNGLQIVAAIVGSRRRACRPTLEYPARSGS